MSLRVPIITEKDKIRFWSKINIKSSIELCWEWQAITADKDGYGRIWMQGKQIRANRAAYFIYYSIDPCEKQVCHSCDNPKCCNPHHLFLGTPKQNVEDSINKGRWASGVKHGSVTKPHRTARGSRSGANTKPEKVPRGVNHWKSKLTSQDIVEIKKLYMDGGITQTQLSKKYSVCQVTISGIVNNKTWMEVSKEKIDNAKKIKEEKEKAKLEAKIIPIVVHGKNKSEIDSYTSDNLPMPNITEKDCDRFWSKMTLTENEDKCWVWKKFSNTYPRFSVMGHLYNSNRISYFIFNKEDPKDLVVCHRCNNKSCCNPHHLFLGTSLENSAHMVKSGRSSKGEKNGHYTNPNSTLKGSKHGMAKLSDSDVLEIREKKLTKYKYCQELSVKYGVTTQMIWMIAQGKSWKHLLPKENLFPKINYAFGYINA